MSQQCAVGCIVQPHTHRERFLFQVHRSLGLSRSSTAAYAERHVVGHAAFVHHTLHVEVLWFREHTFQDVLVEGQREVGAAGQDAARRRRLGDELRSLHVLRQW